MNRVRMVLGCVGFLLLAGACGTCIVIGVIQQRQNEETYGPLAVACSGSGLPAAAAYTPGPGAHHTIGFEQSGGSWSVRTSYVEASRRAQGVADTDVVVCALEERTEQLEVCSIPQFWVGTGSSRHLAGGDFPRTRSLRRYRVVSARTGQVIADSELAGSEPTECYGWVGTEPYGSTFAGSAPGSSEIGVWLDASL